MAVDGVAAFLKFAGYLGLPASCGAIGAALVRTAKAFEKRGNEKARAQVANALRTYNIENAGRFVAKILPQLFRATFGERIISIKFISRSFVASTLLWIVLTFLNPRGPSYWVVEFNLVKSGRADYYIDLVGLAGWYVVDWLSLAKSKLLIDRIEKSESNISLYTYGTIDVVLSYSIVILMVPFVDSIEAFSFGFSNPLDYLRDIIPDHIFKMLSPLSLEGYFGHGLGGGLFSIMRISTLLSAIWSILMILAIQSTIILIPIDKIRRFTFWWFKDIDLYPITTVAVVGSILLFMLAILMSSIRAIGAFLYHFH